MQDVLLDDDRVRRPEIVVVLRPKAPPPYAALIVLRGEHDLGTAEAIRVSLATLLGDLLVDLGECDFVDSSVISTLISKAQELEREGYRLEFVLPPERAAMSRIFDMTGIRNLVTVHECVPGLPRGPGSA
jgi:anti-anti-sigma factor